MLSPQEMPAQTGPQATPEEQQQLETFMDVAFQVIHSEQGRAAMLEGLKFRPPQSPDDESTQAIAALANMTVIVFSKTRQSLEENQVSPDPTVLYEGGTQIMAELATIAQKANIYDYSQEEMDGAWVRAVDQYGAMYRKEKGQAEGQPDQAAAAELREIELENEAGQLEQKSPLLAQAISQSKKKTRPKLGGPKRGGKK